ncbi:MAG: hypothetical protein ACYC1C_11905, partial [Chloroflexota bacterium]
MVWNRLWRLGIVLVLVPMVALGELPNLAAGEANLPQVLNPSSLLVPPNDRFGLNRASYGLELDNNFNVNLSAEAGAAWNRWPMYWYLIENDGGFDYSEYDRAVAQDVIRGT